MATISKDVFSFLNKLKRNNNRDWFNTHKSEFKTVESHVKSVYNYLGEMMNTHDVIDKTKVFRIYRDVRFSKNKLPYKTHFGGSFHRKKPELRGGYYLHIEPNEKSFIAIGFWEPNKDDLKRIRKEFELDAGEIKAILNNKTFSKTWGNFVGEELKTAPRGFDKDHVNIELIRKKQFIFTKNFTDKEVLKTNFIKNVNQAFKDARPYLYYMSDVLTTNLNGESIL
ncbi:DUF2461 domain-containing protein [Winogradskyella litorisediminis]|uniref:DUF2461 domain-containing protein n=1 Tax=Winogradskyella litorisediminis TaxID=1156618 RepID=A0ABW3N4G0_9FLAO